jgi:hypothetical protein
MVENGSSEWPEDARSTLQVKGFARHLPDLHGSFR